MRIRIKTINILSLGCLMALVFCPLLQLYLKVIVYYPLLLIWIVTALFIDNYRISLKRDGLSYLLYICALFLMWYFSTQSSSYLRRVVTVILISYSSVFMYSFYSRHTELVSKHVWFVYACLLFGLFTTIPGLIKYPMASRILATDGELYALEYSQYKKMGIGGYEYIYTLVLFIIFAPSTMAACSGGKKIIMLAVFSGMFLCVFLSGYTTAILLSISMTLVSTVVSNKNAKISVSFFAITIVLILVLVFMEPLLQLIARIADNYNVYYVSTRIKELLNAEETHDILSLERGRLYRNAIINFLNSPFFGVLISHPMLKSGHSQILGYLETFGIFGLPYVLFMLISFKRQTNQLSQKSRRYVLSCCHFFYFIFALINTVDVAYPLVWAGYFVLPIISLVYERNDNVTIVERR